MDHTVANWQILRHLFTGSVELVDGGFRNIKLAERLFSALTLAAKTKRLCSQKRSRNDDSLLNAVGNWLDSREFGAWRNTNSDKPYKGENKELWASFLEATPDYSLKQAIREAWYRSVAAEV